MNVMMMSVCPECRSDVLVDTGRAGQVTRCDHCGAPFRAWSGQGERVPFPPEAPAAAPKRPAVPPSLSVPAVVPAAREEKDLGAWSTGDVILGEYEVERLLGRGGMGKVFLVRSRDSGLRFAAKVPTLASDAATANFLDELRNWIDLPEHPHLVACRFSRTVGGAVVIFAEYVDGRSLDRWIGDEEGQLYKGGPARALERVLDVAIQFAWGLAAAHDLGLVHQDVKPANVLLSADGVVKVADFGLAQARAAADEAETGRTIVVAGAGYHTRAYRSPEQAARRPLSRKTDVWSWGVSVMEMFTGSVTWLAGEVAAEALDRYIADASAKSDNRLPPMPAGVADVLRRCFRREPAERWRDLHEAAEALMRIYEQKTCQRYQRPKPAKAERATPAPAHDRRTTTGVMWDDPRQWLEEALAEDGRDPRGTAADVIPPPSGSRKGNAVADLRAYINVRRIFERLIGDGRKELEVRLALLCIQQAALLRYLGDAAGAVAAYDRAIEIFERTVDEEGRREFTSDLADAIGLEVAAILEAGNVEGAIRLCDRGILIMERMVNDEGKAEQAGELAVAYTNKAVAVRQLGDLAGAVRLYDQGIAILERLVKEEGRGEHEARLANAYQNKAGALSLLGDLAGAARLCDQAIAIREPWVRRGAEDGRQLAAAYVNRADAVRRSGDLAGAARLCDQAIAIYERMVNTAGLRELAGNLAAAYESKAMAAWSAGDLAGAARLSGQAVAVYDRLIKEGRSELIVDLAASHITAADIASEAGNLRAAAGFYDEAIAVYERLVKTEGRQALTSDLAAAYVNRASVALDAGDAAGAVPLYDQAVALYEQLVNTQGRQELAANLAAACLNKAAALKSFGDRASAALLYDQAVALYEQLVNTEGRHELAANLAAAWMNKANLVSEGGDPAGAVRLYGQATAIYEPLVNMEGRRELTNELARVYMNGAMAVKKLGDLEQAARLFEQAIALRERLVHIDGRTELRGELAWVRVYHAELLDILGRTVEAKRAAREAIPVLEAEVRRSGRADLRSVLAWAKRVHRHLL